MRIDVVPETAEIAGTADEFVPGCNQRHEIGGFGWDMHPGSG